MSIHSKVATLRALKTQVVADLKITGTLADGGAIENIDMYNEALFVLNVKNIAAIDTDILDVYIDISPDNDITWINAVRFERILGNGNPAVHIARLKFDAGDLAMINVTTDVNAGTVRPIGIGTMIRYQGEVTEAAAGGASFDYSVQVFLK